VSKGTRVNVLVKDAVTRNPIPDIWVSITQRGEFGRHSGFSSSAYTDANGVARFRIPMKEFNIKATGVYKGYSYFYTDQPITPKAKSDKPDKYIVLMKPDPRVCGIVRNRQGQPVTGAEVKVLPRDYGSVLTDSRGEFEISYKTQGKRQFVFVRDVRSNLAATVEIQNNAEPFDICLEPALTVTGSVTDPDGKPVPAAQVNLTVTIPYHIQSFTEKVITDGNGRYQINTIPPKQKGFTYQLNISAAGYGSLEGVSISSNCVSGPKVELEPFIIPPANRSVSGIVVDGNGKPAANMDVMAYTGSGRGLYQPRRYTITKEDGTFLIKHLCKAVVKIQVGFGKQGGRIHAEGGDTNVKIVLGEEKRRVYTANNSILGKPLPDLKELNLKAYPKEIKGKRILLCFWYIQQQQSIDCVRRLNKQIEYLAGKNISLVLVHASSVRERAFNKVLLEEHGLVLSRSYTCADDIFEARRRWAVETLPWLILTDENHIVTAEGFSISELDKMAK
jgi:hypothetical protein